MKEIKGKIIEFKLKDSSQEPDEDVIITDVKLPDDAPARMKTLRAEGRKWYMTVVYHPQSEKPFALFCTTNSKEKSPQTAEAVLRLTDLAKSKGILEEHTDTLLNKIAHVSNVDKIARTISLLLRHRVPIKDIVNTLEETDEMFVGSFLFQVKKFLAQYIRDGEEVEGGKCEDCGSTHLVFSEGCMACADCGSSKCG